MLYSGQNLTAHIALKFLIEYIAHDDVGFTKEKYPYDDDRGHYTYGTQYKGEEVNMFENKEGNNEEEPKKSNLTKKFLRKP